MTVEEKVRLKITRESPPWGKSLYERMHEHQMDLINHRIQVALIKMESFDTRREG